MSTISGQMSRSGSASSSRLYNCMQRRVLRPSHSCRRGTSLGRSCRAFRICSSSEAAQQLAEGAEKYVRGDRMGALSKFEAALQKNPDQQQRQEALFNATAVHASFGDVELAQITLREAIINGLDFEAAMKDPKLMKIQSSQQVLIQLRKFSEAAKRIKALQLGTPAGSSSSSSSGSMGAVGAPTSSGPAATARSYFKQDVSDMLSTEITDMDASVLGIVKRVSLLLLSLIGLGLLLFFVGYEYTFNYK